VPDGGRPDPAMFHPVEQPGLLEATYLRAKNSADAFGHRKAAAEFFIKELTFRRQKNLQQLGDGDVPLLDRLESGGKAFGNWVLYTTCGYGERLWRVIYISVVIVLAWGLFYTVLTKGTEGAVSSSGLDSPLELLSSSGFVMLGKNIYFSIVTFTTLGYGDVRPVGTVARALAGVESFLGALLLALVVFVLGRRVAW